MSGSGFTFRLDRAPANSASLPGTNYNFPDHPHLDQLKVSTQGPLISISGMPYKLTVVGKNPYELAALTKPQWEIIATNLTNLIGRYIKIDPLTDLTGTTVDPAAVKSQGRTYMIQGHSQALYYTINAAVSAVLSNNVTIGRTPPATPAPRAALAPERGVGPGGAPTLVSPPLLPTIDGVNKSALGRLVVEIDRQARELEGQRSSDPIELYDYVNRLLAIDSRTGLPEIAIRACDAFIRGEGLSRDGQTRTKIAECAKARLYWNAVDAIRKQVYEVIDTKIKSHDSWYMRCTQADGNERFMERQQITKAAAEAVKAKFLIGDTDNIRCEDLRDQIKWQVLNTGALSKLTFARLDQLIKEARTANIFRRAWRETLYYPVWVAGIPRRAWRNFKQMF